MPDLMNLFYDSAPSYQEMFQTILQDFEYDGYTLHYPFGHGTPGGGNSMYAVASVWYKNGNLWTTDKAQRFSDALWNESRFTYYHFPVFTTYAEGMKYARGLAYDASQIVRGTPYPLNVHAGAGSGYIGNNLLSNKKMVGYNVPTSSDTGTKTESVNTYSANAESNKPKVGNGHVRITFLRSN